jgi:hypothetical protein
MLFHHLPGAAMLTSMIQKLLVPAVWGLAAIVLIGPILAVIGVLLPFAIIGIVARGGYREFRRQFWPEARSRAQVPSASAGTPEKERDPRPQRLRQPEHPPQEAIRTSPPHRAPCAARFRAASRMWFLVEVVCGAFVGGALAFLAAEGQPARDFYVVLGAVIGAAVGFGAARGKPCSTKEVAVGNG